MLRIILNNRWTLWGILAIPGLIMIYVHAARGVLAMDLLHPSGEFSARLMIVAMALAPLASLVGPQPWLEWMTARRRYFGVGAFLYALLHLVFYLIDMGNLDDMLAEIGAPGIWTAWIAFALLVPLAVTSNDAAMRRMKSEWKRVQRLVYPAAALLLVHWVLVHDGMSSAIIHFMPLVLLLLARILARRNPNRKGV